MSSDFVFEIVIVDIDSDESLLAQFDELVPVLYARRNNGDSVQLCHYFLDEAKVRNFALNS